MATCPECHSEQLGQSTIPGLMACRSCGKVSPMPAALREQEARQAAEAERNEVTQTGAVELAVPDSIEVQEGWRAWAINVDGAEPVLQSVTKSQHVWTPRAPMVAVCAKKGNANGVQREGHEVPHPSCRCGLYSAKTYERLMGMGYHSYDPGSGNFRCIGKLNLWGKVIEGTQGWRAAIGYPAELYVPLEAWRLARPLAEAYGVPVKLWNILAEDAD